MPYCTPARIARCLSLGFFVMLAACAQQRQPGYYETPRENTVSDALHRAQNADASTAPSQLQFGFGSQQKKVTTAGGPAQATPAGQPAGTGEAAAAPAARTTAIPENLSETRTYLGTIPCPDGGVCPAMRMTLTLAPDGQWRARSRPANGSGPVQTALGCWFLTGTAPVRITLQAGEQSYASLEFTQSNVLRLLQLNGQVPLLESRLTRQADIDPIDELSAQPARSCPAR